MNTKTRPRFPVSETSARIHILLATTGSVASIKLPSIVKSLSIYFNIELQVVTTAHSLHFYEAAAVLTHDGEPVKVCKDADEWSVSSCSTCGIFGRFITDCVEHQPEIERKKKKLFAIR
ncbi:hypothetical protein CROQUDRAFT_352738 [Cronartium quercuum f. sp. fusiforme G11]|uniref:Flavoprotein domain-containing protein n=1 Tax=Cronartium quercuum f. sp. fusiforme G11 TaxID=708437 RepID=A0A9P6NLD6_9BASI|nr:hypothetical protein CROQUDRAFT_352738 [Cronartium quercuum f. sp. fusiforme G11]